MSETALRGSIEFLERLGVFDVILPFLLVFTIMFGFLEKTKILGVEKSGDEKLTKKNLNSMVAFVIAFFVVASVQLVSLINEITANVALVLILIFSALLLIGSFQQEKDEAYFFEDGLNKPLQAIVFFAILLIFLNAMNWLEPILDFISDAITNEVMVAAVLIFVVLGSIFFVVTDRKGGKKE